MTNPTNIQTTEITNATLATLAALNAGADPKSLGGERLGDDGQNELWLFGQKVANKYTSDETGEPEWSDDVAGWNYDPETDAID